jgi:hypothetical protein
VSPFQWLCFVLCFFLQVAGCFLPDLPRWRVLCVLVRGSSAAFVLCIVLCTFRDWVVLDVTSCESVCDSLTRKGLFVLQKPKRVWLITRKGLVTNVLDSSLDLSSYASV